jgi:hypothetical protein
MAIGFSEKLLKHLMVIVALVFAASLRAQEVWHPIQLSSHGKTIDTLKAFGIKAKGEYDGQNFDAFVFVWGRLNSEIYNVGFVVPSIKDVIPDAALDEYRGPDLSTKAINRDCLKINICGDKGAKVFSTRMVMGATVMLPDSVRGSAKEYFGSNVRPGVKDAKAWRELLTLMSQGFREGSIALSEDALSKKIVIKFQGEGSAPVAKDLVQFITKK